MFMQDGVKFAFAVHQVLEGLHEAEGVKKSCKIHCGWGIGYEVVQGSSFSSKGGEDAWDSNGCV